MKTFMKSKFFKPFLSLISLAVIIFYFSPIPTNAAYVTKADILELIEKADEEKGATILKALQFNEDQTAFSDFDVEYAKNNGLIEKDYVNVEVFFDLGYEEFLIFKEAKLAIEKENDGFVTYASNSLKDMAKLATVIAAMVFVGQAIIKELTSDLYKLGAKRFCKKFQKKYTPIRNACKDLGYIK